MSLDGLSLAPLVCEINTRLSGGRIDKIFQPDQYSLLLWIRQPGENLRLLISVNPERPKIFLAASAPENPSQPPSFCMLLRKHLEDGRISAIEQHSLDRIVNINIDVRGERGLIVTKRLVIEIMGKHSNIILTQDNKIIDAIRRVSTNISRHRQVLPGKDYVYPPGQDRLNILDITAAEFVSNMVKNQTGSIAKAIIGAAIGIGPLTAREMVWRSGFAANIGLSELDDADLAALADAIDSIVIPIKTAQIKPTVVVESTGRPLAIAAFTPEHLAQYQRHELSSMSAAVEFFDKFKGRPATPEKDLLSKLIFVELGRLTRKQVVLTEELAQAENAECLRRCADIVMSNLYVIQPGTPEETLLDIYDDSGEGRQVVITLDPVLSPIDNAQNYYAKYNKAKRAQEWLAIQLRECREEIAYLDSVAVALEYAAVAAEVADIRQELAALGYIKTADKRRLPTVPSLPLTAQITDGFTVIIGKNNRQNDMVTFKQAGPDDLWLHTKDIPGSHVIIRAEKRDISVQAISEAAYLAAYFSKSRQSANVPVDYTKRRHVRKPSGAKPGFVIYDHQSTIYVTPDAEVVNKLLNPRQTL